MIAFLLADALAVPTQGPTNALSDVSAERAEALFSADVSHSTRIRLEQTRGMSDIERRVHIADVAGVFTVSSMESFGGAVQLLQLVPVAVDRSDGGALELVAFPLGVPTLLEVGSTIAITAQRRTDGRLVQSFETIYIEVDSGTRTANGRVLVGLDPIVTALSPEARAAMSYRPEVEILDLAPVPFSLLREHIRGLVSTNSGVSP